MPVARRSALWQAIDALEAQEHLSLIKCLTYPKLKESDRISFDSKLRTAAYPTDIYTSVQSTPAVDLHNSILGRLRGIIGK